MGREPSMPTDQEQVTLELTEEERAYLRRWYNTDWRDRFLIIILKLQARVMKAEFNLEHTLSGCGRDCYSHNWLLQ